MKERGCRLVCRKALIHLCELDLLKLFLDACFEGSSCHRLVGRHPEETEMLHIRKAKPCMRLWHTRAEEYVGEKGGV